MKLQFSFFLPLLTILPCLAQDEADAPPLSPQEQQKRFHLPPGFEIQLVASEPEIQKPMNLSFDPSGRLWVTGTGMYPFAAKTDVLGNPIPEFDSQWNGMAGNTTGGVKPEPAEKPIDTLRVLSDLGPDGRAGKITTFADGLNIPIGVQPLPMAPGDKGAMAIVFSIPTIWKMTDTDGDGKADLREPLYDRFGFTDTHGMSSNYLQWADGWIYGCHGFSNSTEVSDSSGTVTKIHSGNVYRFRPDGSKFEIFSSGQTNPFGLTFDEKGNLYSCDSHSKPGYLLVKGGYVEGIGKNHDGLGFLPAIMNHSHGSSAIAGISYYGADAFPEEFRNNLFIGNPITRRINRDRLEWTGDTPKAIEMEDFISCDDPWFRPIQVKLGPDGALYIADFYNPIIGHYESPLFDPRRDKVHGRIWRVVWKGGDTKAPATLPDLTALDDKALVSKFNYANLEVRRLAKNLALVRKLEVPDASLPPSHRLEHSKDNIPTLFSRFKSTTPGDELTLYSIRVALRDIIKQDGAFGKSEITGASGADADLVATTALAVPGEASARHLLGYMVRSDLSLPQGGRYSSEIIRHLVANWPAEKFEELQPLAEKFAAGSPRLGLEFTQALEKAEAERGLKLPDSLRPWTEKYALASLGSDDAAILDLAIGLIAPSVFPEKSQLLEKIISQTGAPVSRRVSALAALSNVPAGTSLSEEILLHQSDAPSELLRQAVNNLSESKEPSAIEALVSRLPSAPAALAVPITASLAKDDSAAEKLLALIESGKASPSLLRHKLVAGEISHRSETIRTRTEALAKNLPPENERLDAVIAARAAAFPAAQRDRESGKQIFATHCAACHKFKNEGGNLAPNLDGVGASRGPQRLMEDILDPNRNIDATFRLVTIHKKDGSEVSGINLRDEAGNFLLTDTSGKELKIPKGEAEEPRVGTNSVMPAVFEQIIPEANLNHLVEYLLQP